MNTELLTNLFSSVIWGTVSDWIMIGVTSLTAFYLYKTLNSQKEVQHTQNELFKIESIRFKESIKPKLKYSANHDQMIPTDVSKRIITLEVTNETDCLALNISKIVSENKDTNQIFIPMGYSDKRDHLTKGDNPILFHFIIDSHLINFLVIAIKYEDIAGTKYSQRVFCVYDENKIEIHPSLPEFFQV